MARSTLLSTNATCQPEKLENSQVKTWGSASTLGVELGPPRCVSSNRRARTARENLRNVEDTCEGAAGCCCQQNSRSELGQKGVGSPARIRTSIHGSKGHKMAPDVSERTSEMCARRHLRLLNVRCRTARGHETSAKHTARTKPRTKLNR